MPDTMFVAPAAGLQVRRPGTGQPLPAEGALVPRTAYWLRRLAEGDIAVRQSRADVARPEDAAAPEQPAAPESPTVPEPTEPKPRKKAAGK